MKVRKLRVVSVMTVGILLGSGDGRGEAPTISGLSRTEVQIPVQTILFDIGNANSYRGLSVANPDQNGNHWNSVWSGAYYPDVIDLHGNVTEIDFGFSSATGTDSYNGPAGPTDVGPLTSVVHNTDIDVEALGNLSATNAVFDFYVNSSFEIQGLDPNRRYNLTFFGSHKYSADPISVYSVYTDDAFTTLVASTNLNVQEPGMPASHNRDTVATLYGLAPQTNNILYVKFAAATPGALGYLNALQVEATGPAEAALVQWQGQTGTVYRLEEATDAGSANWTGVVTGIEGQAGSMSAPAVLSGDSAAYRVAEQVPLFFDDFESGANGWTVGVDGAATTAWELGTPSNAGPAGANSGANCWGTNIDGGYTFGAECWLRSPAIDLTEVDEASLVWQHAVDIEDDLEGAFYDWGEVNILDTNNVVLLNEVGGKVAGEDLTPPWQSQRHALADVVGQVIKIEFRFTSDTEIRNASGWYIDDVEITSP